MREVAVIGTGATKFGELWEKSFRDIGITAGLEAVKDAGITSNDIDAVYIGNMSAGRFISQQQIGALIADYAGLAARHIPATRVEAAMASGGLALRQGFMAVACGIHDFVVVGGAEKMMDVDDTEAIEILASSADQETEAFFGATYPSLYAMIARRHMHEHGTTREEMAEVVVKNHFHGSKNPKAQFQKEMSLEAVLNAPMVAEPLGMMDCAPLSDGAAAVILCPLSRASEFTDKPVKISGTGQASDTMALHDRKDICIHEATREAAKSAYKMSGREPHDIQVAEVHDSFSIAEIMAIEDLGLVKRGGGAKATKEGVTKLGGRIPVNTSGGLKARGNPLGATGIAQAVEIVDQLKGRAGLRQVKDARVGLTHNVGGSGSTAVVHVFEAGW